MIMWDVIHACRVYGLRSAPAISPLEVLISCSFLGFLVDGATWKETRLRHGQGQRFLLRGLFIRSGDGWIGVELLW